MRYLMLFLLFLVSPQIWGQVEFNPQATRSQAMSWGFAAEHLGQIKNGITTCSVSEHHISVVFISTDTHETTNIFHGGVRFVGTDRSDGSELYLHESQGLIIGFIINWKTRTLQIEYEGTAEHFFYVDDICEECTEQPPVRIEIPQDHKPNKIEFKKLDRL